jgi:ketol-acid reductoisomerase
MKQVLHEIQDGTFASKWLLENLLNRPAFTAARQNEAAHPIEQVGSKLRDMMPWLKK